MWSSPSSPLRSLKPRQRQHDRRQSLMTCRGFVVGLTIALSSLSWSSSGSSSLPRLAFVVPPSKARKVLQRSRVGDVSKERRDYLLRESGNEQGGEGGFSLANLFGRSSSSSSSSSASSSTTATTSSKTASTGSKEQDHPSVRPHISPLNRLHPEVLSKLPAVDSGLLVHPDVTSGVLEENGFSYIILPNKSPPGRFEAHLQVFSGSADELEAQQGIAHLTEHVAYMGSRKRERLFGTGSQTNAYTDFHHTVFYAACPTYLPGTAGKTPMVPLALDALRDVMEARVEPSRLEKERAAVLSEMTMVNTIEYRVECQILSSLHRENRLAKRFPIGKEVLIKSWQPDDVKSWHRTHYRPDNVLLYVVGDVGDLAQTKEWIRQRFGDLSASKQARDIKIPAIRSEAAQLASAVVDDGTMKAQQSWHYPPVRHDWCVPKQQEEPWTAPPLEEISAEEEKEAEAESKERYDLQLRRDYELDEKMNPLFTLDPEGSENQIRSHIYRHELLQSFSLHLFAKRPVQPIVDLPSFRRSLAFRVALAALQVRLNVGGRSDDPACTFIEFNQLDSAREGCAVCSLDMTAEPPRWREAVKVAVKEICKLGRYGVTPNEMDRYASALLTDAEQLAAQGDRIGNADQLAHLMETVANGHIFMSPEQSYEVTAQALSTLTLEEVNAAAAELCSHVTSLNPKETDADKQSRGAVVAVACTPRRPDETESDDSYCSSPLLVEAILEASQEEVEPEEDVVVPHSLVKASVLDAAMAQQKPSWKGGEFSDGTPSTSAEKLTKPFTLRRLDNGMRVGITQNSAESQRGHLRLVAPGGRDAERRLGLAPGSMAVGARAMQEGGAFAGWSREQVELFCVDHLIMVEINCNEESLLFDFVFPTIPVGNVGFGENKQLGITGTEAVLQIVREVLSSFQWEEDALGRSKQSYRSSHEGLQKNLEGKTTEIIMEQMTGMDSRFLSIDIDTVNAVTLEDAKKAVMSQLQPSELELSVAGDFNVRETLDMILRYIGTIPTDVNAQYVQPNQFGHVSFGGVPPLKVPGPFLELELSDSDPRAVSYVAGAAPNLWGFLADGSTVAERVAAADKRATEFDRQRRAHPLFANVALALLSEVVNRRLFSTVRERKQLTYDANFSLTGFERLQGGWFLVTVTASKEKAPLALEACKETLAALRKSNPITADNLESAKRVILNRHEGELRTSSYWSMLMSGIQQDSIPLKGPLSVTDFYAIVQSMTTRDVQLTLETLNLQEQELYTAIGRTVQPEGLDPADDIVMASPMAGMGRGGALTG